MKGFIAFAFVFALGLLGSVSGRCRRCWRYGTEEGPCVNNTCPCKEGYTSDTCGWCLKKEGWHGNKKVCCQKDQFHDTSVSCKDCDCNPEGVLMDMSCKPKGQCTCKDSYYGKQCNNIKAQVLKIGDTPKGYGRTIKISCDGICNVTDISATFDEFNGGVKGDIDLYGCLGIIYNVDNLYTVYKGPIFCKGDSNSMPEKCLMQGVNINTDTVYVYFDSFAETKNVEFHYTVGNFKKIEIEYYCGCNEKGADKLTCDPQGKCTCKAGYKGDRCYDKDCGCNPKGAEKLTCDSLGKCTCKNGYTGDQCYDIAAQVLKIGDTPKGYGRTIKISCDGICNVTDISATFDELNEGVKGDINLYGCLGIIYDVDNLYTVYKGPIFCKGDSKSMPEKCLMQGVNINTDTIYVYFNSYAETKNVEFHYTVGNFKKIEIEYYCGCNEKGADKLTCDPQGICTCKTGYKGNRCYVKSG